MSRFTPDPARNDDFHVDLHLTGEGHATADVDRVTRFVTDLLTALQRETAVHVSVRLVVAYDDRRISERPLMEDFAARFPVAAGQAGPISFTLEDATTRRVQDPRWERQPPDLTISCSYHVAMTSLLHDVPVVYLFGNDYYRQKAASLQAGFGLSPELTVDIDDPEADAGLVASIAVGVLSNPQRQAETINRLRLARARALALRHLVSSRLIRLISAHMASTLEGENVELSWELVSRSVTSDERSHRPRWIAVKRTLALLRSWREAIRSEKNPESSFEGLQRSVDELRASVEGLSNTLTSVGQTTEGHTAWLSDLQRWTRSCVQTLSTLADVAPIPSARVQAECSAGAPARRDREGPEAASRLDNDGLVGPLRRAVRSASFGHHAHAESM